MEKTVSDWIVEQRKSALEISIKNTIAKELSYNRKFKDEDNNMIFHWVYPFFVQWKLSIPMATRTG